MHMNFYRKKDALLLTESNTFSSLINGSASTYGLTTAQASDYADLNNLYATAYNTALTPATRTRVTVLAKNEARKNMVELARQLADYIIGNMDVTNAQLAELGLDPRTSRTPAPVPETAPDIDILSVVGRVIKIRIHDASVGKRGKPKYVKGATVFVHYGPTPPEDVSSWTFAGSITRNVFEWTVPGTVAPGSQVWITAFWFNNKSQAGPAALPVSTYTQYGPVSMAA